MFKKKYKRICKLRSRLRGKKIKNKKIAKLFPTKNKLIYKRKKNESNSLEKKKRNFLKRLGEKKAVIYKRLIIKLKKIRKANLRKPILKRIYRLLKKKRIKKTRSRGYLKRNTYKPWHKFWRGLQLPKLKKRNKIYKLKKGIFNLSKKLKHNHMIFKSTLNYIPPMISHDVLSKKNRYSRIIMLYNFSKLVKRAVLLRENKKLRIKQIKKISLFRRNIKQHILNKYNTKQNIRIKKTNTKIIKHKKKHVKKNIAALKKIKEFVILKNKKIKIRTQRIISSVELRKKNKNVQLKDLKINKEIKDVKQVKIKDPLQQNEKYISYLKDTLLDFFEIKENILALEKTSHRTKLFSDIQKEIENIQEMQKNAAPLNLSKRPLPLIKKTNQKVQSFTPMKYFLRQKFNNRKTFFYWIQDIFVSRRGIYQKSHSNIFHLKKNYLTLKKKYNILRLNQLKTKKIAQFFFERNNKVFQKKDKKIKYPVLTRLKKYKNIFSKQLKQEGLYKIYFTKDHRYLNKKQRKYIKRKQYRYNIFLKNYKIISDLYKKQRQFTKEKVFGFRNKGLMKINKLFKLKKNILFYKFYLSLYRKALVLQNKKHFIGIQKYSLNKDHGIEYLIADF